LKVTRADLFEPRVLAPCIVMVLSVFAYGTLFTIIPDFGVYHRIENTGLLFTYFTVASLLIRLVAGKSSDIYGRITVLKFSTVLVTLGMLIIGFSDSKMMLIAGVCTYGVAQGATSPTLLAWATDLSSEEHKGRGIASLYIFMELGIGLGAFCSGWIFANDTTGFLLPFAISATLSALAFLYLWAQPSRGFA
jgi:MFS family permease